MLLVDLLKLLPDEATDGVPHAVAEATAKQNDPARTKMTRTHTCLDNEGLRLTTLRRMSRKRKGGGVQNSAFIMLLD